MFWTIKGYYFEFDDYFYGSGEGNKGEEVDLTLVGRKHVQTILLLDMVFDYIVSLIKKRKKLSP